MSDHPIPSDADLARVAADKLGLRLPACDDGVVRFVLVNCLVALERARVVGVLDAWAEKTKGWWTTDTFLTPGIAGWVCEMEWPGGKRTFSRETPDAARAAAAKAIEAGEV